MPAGADGAGLRRPAALDSPGFQVADKIVGVGGDDTQKFGARGDVAVGVVGQVAGGGGTARAGGLILANQPRHAFDQGVAIGDVVSARVNHRRVARA